MKSVCIRIGILISLLLIVHAAYARGFSEERTFSYRGLVELQIDAGMFDLSIESASGNEIFVEVRDIPRGISVLESKQGDSAHIHIRGRNSWLFRNHGTPRIIVSVPAAIGLDIEMGSGDMRLEGVRGDLRVQSGSGDIEIRDAGGAITVETGSGDLTVARTTGEFTLESGSGDVDLERCSGRFSIDLASGRIEGDEIELRGDSLFSTASGDIELRLRNGLDDLRYEISTASGDIRWGEIRSERTLSGGGGRYSVVLESSSGSIDVR